MTRAPRTAARRVLRWIFRRGNRFLNFEVDHVPGDAYTLSLVPWGMERGVETCETGVSAFQRHSDITSQLRQSGWSLVAYTVGATRPLARAGHHKPSAPVSALSLLFRQPRAKRTS